MDNPLLHPTEPDLPHPPDIGIGKLLWRAHLAFRNEFRKRLSAEGMTFGEFVHLERLWHQDGLNQTELSRRVGIETASSTKTIESLERRQLIRRERNRDDRRHIHVFLTPEGLGMRDALLACAKSTNLAARAGLSATETVTLFALLGRIVDNLEDLANERKRRPNQTGT